MKKLKLSNGTVAYNGREVLQASFEVNFAVWDAFWIRKKGLWYALIYDTGTHVWCWPYQIIQTFQRREGDILTSGGRYHSSGISNFGSSWFDGLRRGEEEEGQDRLLEDIPPYPDIQGIDLLRVTNGPYYHSLRIAYGFSLSQLDLKESNGIVPEVNERVILRAA